MKEGWEKKKLGDVCEFITRGISPIYIEKNGLVVLNQKCIRNHKINYELSRIHNNKIKPVKGERLLKAGDVLVNSTGTGTLGRLAQVEEDVKATVDSHITIVRPVKGLFHNSFFGYAMVNIEEDISEGGEGCGGQTELSRTKLKDGYWISFPKSINSQKDIVKILNNTFTAIDQAIVNTEKNLQNAQDIFQSYLLNIFSNPSEDWEENKLQEIVDPRCKLSYGIVQPGNEHPNGLPIVRPTDLTNKFVPLKGLKLINPQLANSYKKTTLFGNELLLCVRGNTGVISIATEELKGANVTRGIVPICFNPKKLILQFGYYLFISDFIQKQIKDKTYGAALMQINIGDLRQISTLIPPLAEQQAIVKKLDIISSSTKKLETIYQQKIKALHELKKSLLQKAFTGELNLSNEKILA